MFWLLAFGRCRTVWLRGRKVGRTTRNFRSRSRSRSLMPRPSWSRSRSLMPSLRRFRKFRKLSLEKGPGVYSDGVGMEGVF